MKAARGAATWLRLGVIHRVAVQLHELLRLGLLLSVTAHGERVLTDLQHNTPFTDSPDQARAVTPHVAIYLHPTSLLSLLPGR